MESVTRFAGDTKEVTCASFHSSGIRYATGGCDGLSLWKVGFVASEASFSKFRDVTSISYDSDKFVCAGSRNGSIKMYVRTITQLYLLELTQSQFNGSNTGTI